MYESYLSLMQCIQYYVSVIYFFLIWKLFFIKKIILSYKLHVYTVCLYSV